MDFKGISVEDFNVIRTISDKQPTFFFDNVLGASYWDMQRQIAEAVFRFPRVSVKSCHGAGKSYIAARIAIAFLSTYPDSIVVTTAPTFRQVKDILWREINGAYAKSKSPIGGNIFTVKLEFSENWYGVGVSSDKSDNMQGYHAPSGHILVIGDEAAGIPNQTAEAMEVLLTSSGARLLYIGNPTNTISKFYDSFLDNQFQHFSIPAFITPNFVAAGIRSVADLEQYKDEAALLQAVGNPPFPYLITPAWAYGRLKKWGAASPMFLSRVCAEFPAESDVTLLPHYLVEKCLNKEFRVGELESSELQRCIGIDVARKGSNNTVLTAINKMDVLEVESFNGRRIPETVAAAKNMFDRLHFDKETDYICVDDTGVGGGVTDLLMEDDYQVIPVNFGSKPTPGNEKRYVNIKAELYWYLRERMEKATVRILDEGDLLKQIPTIQFKWTSQQKLQIVSKEEMERAGQESPDYADSLALAVWGTNLGGTYMTESDPDDIDSSPTERGVVGGNLFAKRF